jgi:SAM-dependent methyltransferase
MEPSDDERQRQYFDLTEHQYPRETVVRPPLHTVLELERVLEALKDVPHDGPIIDFGSGTGRMSIALARAGYSVLAVDVSERSLALLSEIARELDLSAIQTASALPSEDRFPAVVGADILHHVDLNEYLPRIHTSLRRGGKAIFSEPGALNPAWYVYLPLFHDLRVEKRIVTCNLFHLRRRFEQHGFRDVRITGLGLLPRPLFGWASTACRWHDAVGNWPVLRWFAYRYLVEARK